MVIGLSRRASFVLLGWPRGRVEVCGKLVSPRGGSDLRDFRGVIGFGVFGI
jgi:hypothetical protein